MSLSQTTFSGETHALQVYPEPEVSVSELTVCLQRDAVVIAFQTDQESVVWSSSCDGGDLGSVNVLGGGAVQVYGGVRLWVCCVLQYRHRRRAAHAPQLCESVMYL